MNLLAGTTICGSELGHYNFQYPNLNISTSLIKDITVECPTWPLQYRDGISFRACKFSTEDKVFHEFPSYIFWILWIQND